MVLLPYVFDIRTVILSRTMDKRTSRYADLLNFAAVRVRFNSDYINVNLLHRTVPAPSQARCTLRIPVVSRSLRQRGKIGLYRAPGGARTVIERAPALLPPHQKSFLDRIVKIRRCSKPGQGTAAGRSSIDEACSAEDNARDMSTIIHCFIQGA